MIFRKYASGCFMVSILAVGFAISLITVYSIRDNAGPLKPDTVLKGQWASLYEDHYNKDLRSFDLSKNIWGLFNYAAFREGSDGVLISDNGWLFTTEEFEWPAHALENYRKNMDYIADAARKLEKENITLVIAPVPAKARIYEDYLHPYTFPSYKEKAYEKFVKDLEGKGIEAVDILSVMQKMKKSEGHKVHPLYLKTDTHWTPHGANIAAESVAEYIRAFNLLDKQENFVSTKGKPKDFAGDLTRYVPVYMFADYISAPKENIVTYKTTEKAAPEEEPEDIGSALFGENVPPVTLVGTSYSANENWNFDGFLKEHLQSDVLNAAEEGLGPFETMQEYLSDQAFLETPPKIVIWEIPERFLYTDYKLASSNEKQVL